ncbi:MAG: polysaccharide biosynthesis tyrosine autokinase [Oscillospiraceae bacterium]|nr:polysaccharide biosynthesis tyrosine autokinase [Oscillospiraceae bacterium]
MEHSNEYNSVQSAALPFDPIVIVIDVLKRWLLIVLAALIVGVCTYIAVDAAYKPIYQTNTTFVVTNRSSSSTVYSNLSSANSLATVFTDLLNSSILHKTIAGETGITNFDGTVTAAVIPETNLITMKVAASDPRTAFLVTRAIIEHHEELTYQVVGGISLEVLQSPSVPSAPVNRSNAAGQMKRMMLIAAVGMCIVIAWYSYTRDKIRSEREVRRKLDCSCLGEIPHEDKYKTLRARIKRRKTSILITKPATGFRFTEAVRKLRQRVEQRMGDGNVLMVTSLLENEGKSTIAVNLALALAKKHGNVLLIDCDMHKPACHMLLEQKNVEKGLRDVLAGSVKLADTVRQYKNTNLYLLLERKSNLSSGDLLASERMQALINWAKNEFDYVVLDLPPMSVVSDAETVMELADASILVVRQNMSTARGINKAIAALDSGKAKLLGCVLNNTYSTFLYSGQGSRYGVYGKYGKYRYGHYGNYGVKASDKSGR